MSVLLENNAFFHTYHCALTTINTEKSEHIVTNLQNQKIKICLNFEFYAD